MGFTHKKTYKHTQTVPTSSRKKDSFYTKKEPKKKKQKFFQKKEKLTQKEVKEEKQRKTTSEKKTKIVLHFVPIKEPKRRNYDSDCYTTPKWLIERILVFKIDIDCCASLENSIVPVFYSKEKSFLENLFENKTCFLNPPYSRILPFILHAIKLHIEKNNKFIILIPGSSSTQYYQALETAGGIFYKFRKYLKFNHPERKNLKGCPYSCELVTLGLPRLVESNYIEE